MAGKQSVLALSWRVCMTEVSAGARIHSLHGPVPRPPSLVPEVRMGILGLPTLSSLDRLVGLLAREQIPAGGMVLD